MAVGAEGGCIQYLARVDDMCDPEGEGGKRRGERRDDGDTGGVSVPWFGHTIVPHI